MQNEQDKQSQDTFKIYRIEHSVLRCGPMNGKDKDLPVWYELFKEHSMPAEDLSLMQWLRKTSQYDEDYIIPEHLYFGLTDKERLYTLILNHDAVIELQRSGYKVYTYEITKAEKPEDEVNYKVFSSINQVCFLS